MYMRYTQGQNKEYLLSRSTYIRTYVQNQVLTMTASYTVEQSVRGRLAGSGVHLSTVSILPVLTLTTQSETKNSIKP